MTTFSKRIAIPRTFGKAATDRASETTTEFLYNEAVAVLETRDEWSFIQNQADDYQAWIETAALGENVGELGEFVCVVGSTTGSAAPDDKDSAETFFCGTRISIVEETTVEMPSGEAVTFVRDRTNLWFPTQHFKRVPTGTDHVGIARQFIGTPYVWGGKTVAGVDCSGLVQVSLAVRGIQSPRDSRPQSKSLGHQITLAEAAYGDFLYVPGHVVICLGEGRCLHADGRAMVVHEDSIDNVVSARGFTADNVVVRRV